MDVRLQCTQLSPPLDAGWRDSCLLPQTLVLTVPSDSMSVDAAKITSQGKYGKTLPAAFPLGHLPSTTRPNKCFKRNEKRPQHTDDHRRTNVISSQNGSRTRPLSNMPKGRGSFLSRTHQEANFATPAKVSDINPVLKFPDGLPLKVVFSSDSSALLALA